MKKYPILFVILFLTGAAGLSFPAHAQLLVSNALTPQQWVQNVLIGQGVTVSNVVYTGNVLSAGTFTGITNIGLNSGVILTSGSINNAPGPNSSGSITYSSGSGSDPDLAIAANGTINDKCILEFDFIPEADSIKFRYVFGSDEYHEWANSSFNDVFGFFLSGPGITGPYTNNAANIALIPGTFTPVSINNINNGTANTGPCMNCTYLISNTGGTTIEYDAFTVVLTAKAAVTPCQTYHIKLAISDVGDAAYDSGVFLEENSFTSSSISVTTSFFSPGNPSLTAQAAIEGCRKAKLTFTLPFARTDSSFVYVDSIKGSATNGVDYNFMPDSVLILPYHINGDFVIDPFYDGVPEGTEYVDLYIRKSICDTVDTIISIPIYDYLNITMTTSPDTILCEGQAQLWANPVGGYPPYTIQWSPIQTLNNATILNPVASPHITTTYHIQIKDSTRCSIASDSVIVEYHLRPLLSIKPEPFNGCDPLTVRFLNNSSPQNQTYFWDFGDGTTSTDKEPIHVFHYSPNVSMFNVALHAITSEGCSDSLKINNLVQVFQNPVALFTPIPDSTIIEEATITFNNNTGLANATYLWKFGDSLNTTSTDPDPTFTYLQNGIYTVWLYVTTDKGCRDSISHEVKIVEEIDLELTIPNIITPNGDTKNDVFLITNLENYSQSDLVVFDRWGRKVFSQSPYLNDWDGDNLPDGVYYFLLRYKRKREVHTYDGTLTIMR